MLQINGDRLHRRWQAMAQIGATPGGGVTRLALSDEDREARDQFVTWLHEAGLSVTIDEMGNIFGRRAGKEQQEAPVLFGSHLDSVVQGGKYDGVLGVLAALEVVETLNDQGIETRRPLEIVSWTNEEGARFAPAMLSSGVMAQAFTVEYAYAREDKAGKRFGDELVRIGYRGEAPCRPRPLHAYLEYHIEQGPVLEAAGVPIGVVEGIVGIAWLKVRFAGQADHAGPTPMSMRHDALAAAAKAIVAAQARARAGDGDLVITVGSVDITPNVVNVIPGEVVMTVDIRHPDLATIRETVAALSGEIEAIAEDEHVDVRVEQIWESSPTPFAPEVIGAVAAAAEALGYPSLHLMSGAGHDAKYMADLTATGMIFVPSKGGKSHTEIEETGWEEIVKGANVLLHSVLRLAE